MKIAILGSRGIPNAYGGFEQYAESLSAFLATQGCEVYVYCSSSHPYKDKKLNNVHLKHQYDPESWMGTIGQFIYDYNCIKDARKEHFDIIYQLGYTSSAIFNWMMPSKSKLITNMDGLEWQRQKYNRWVQKFLRWSEGIVVKSSHFLVADALPIKDYLKKKYDVEAYYSAYSTPPPHQSNEALLATYSLEKNDYDLLIARMEPENNIETIIDAHVSGQRSQVLVVVGNVNNKFGKYITKKFGRYPLVRFLGAIYDKPLLDTLRQCARFYFHGHSVGGTNPSLLEAMANGCKIIAHDNPFNKSVLNGNALFFRSGPQLTGLLSRLDDEGPFFERAARNNRTQIDQVYCDVHVFGGLYGLFGLALGG